jgi:hypothetical protein
MAGRADFVGQLSSASPIEPATQSRRFALQSSRGAMPWQRSDRFDPRAVALADRHYSRQKPGTPQFMKTGSCCVFYARTETGEAVWGTSWQQFAKHEWAGAWECAIFRNEGAGRSSRLIRQAVAATRAHYGEPPAEGMITFVNAEAVTPKRDPGHCFIIAGFRPVGKTASGLIVLHLTPEKMPAAASLSFGDQGSLFDLAEAA